MRMRCPDPPAHKGGESGGYMAPLIFLGAAILFAAFGWVVNLLLIGVLVAAFVLVAGVVTMLLIRAHRHILGGGQVRYVPQMSQPKWRPGPPPVQQAAPQVHLNFHTAEAVEAFRRAVERGR